MAFDYLRKSLQQHKSKSKNEGNSHVNNILSVFNCEQ